jgi:hypothetical protein
VHGQNAQGKISSPKRRDAADENEQGKRQGEHCDLPDTLRRPTRLGNGSCQRSAVREQHERGESNVGPKERPRGSTVGPLCYRLKH